MLIILLIFCFLMSSFRSEQELVGAEISQRNIEGGTFRFCAKTVCKCLFLTRYQYIINNQSYYYISMLFLHNGHAGFDIHITKIFIFLLIFGRRLEYPQRKKSTTTTAYKGHIDIIWGHTKLSHQNQKGLI